MTDSRKLYFIPVLGRAWSSQDPIRAMEEAVDKIRRLGNQPGYQDGYRHFIEFIKEAFETFNIDAERTTPMIPHAIKRCILDLATDTFDGDEDQIRVLKHTIKKHPKWSIEYDQIKEEAKDVLFSEGALEVEVLRGKRLVGSVSITKASDLVSPIFPGRYTIRLSNGRVLWKGDIPQKDVIWAYAFPGKDLTMAAETAALQHEPTRTWTLLDNELTIHVFAGLESGRLRITGGQNLR